tara:strand:+ start:1628 stop:1858 length:231 start_codon:yes stop_codon:yes gene_type:complete
MPREIRLKADAVAATGVPLVMTYSSNAPTAASTQTIANGTVPTVAELGQFTANQILINDALISDIAVLRAVINDNG